MANDFIKRRNERDRKFFDAGMMFGLQLSKDFHDISLTSESVMGEKVLTRDDLIRLAENCSALDDYFHNAFTDHVEADHLQEQMDRILRDIYGDDLIVKQYDYVKSRKGWPLMPKPWENKSGCKDPTAYNALYPGDEAKRVSMFMDAIRALATLCGFEILNWVKIRVKKTGNEY